MALIIPMQGKEPRVHPSAFVAANATLIGDVTIAHEGSVWFGAVLRGDTNTISVGEQSNIQDLSVLHVDGDHPLSIGRLVTVGHRAIIHGCTIADRVLVGMGSIVMNGAVIGEDSIIGAGSVVTEGTVVPPRSLVIGLPAKVKRPLTDHEVASIWANALHYAKLRERYLCEGHPCGEHPCGGRSER